MAAEKTPNRRKQCIFHRTFLKSPFGQFPRKRRSSGSGCSSSYDVHHTDSSQHTREIWSPIDSSNRTFNHRQPHPGQNGDSGGRSGPLNFDPSDNLYEIQDQNVFLEPGSMVNHEANPGLAPPNYIDHQNMDFRDVSLDAEVDSDYCSVSHAGDESPPHIASPPSPSVCSMETDIGIDPETGERALD